MCIVSFRRFPTRKSILQFKNFTNCCTIGRWYLARCTSELKPWLMHQFRGFNVVFNLRESWGPLAFVYTPTSADTNKVSCTRLSWAIFTQNWMAWRVKPDMSGMTWRHCLHLILSNMRFTRKVKYLVCAISSSFQTCTYNIRRVRNSALSQLMCVMIEILDLRQLLCQMRMHTCMDLRPWNCCMCHSHVGHIAIQNLYMRASDPRNDYLKKVNLITYETKKEVNLTDLMLGPGCENVITGIKFLLEVKNNQS